MVFSWFFTTPASWSASSAEPVLRAERPKKELYYAPSARKNSGITRRAPKKTAVIIITHQHSLLAPTDLSQPTKPVAPGSPAIGHSAASGNGKPVSAASR